MIDNRYGWVMFCFMILFIPDYQVVMIGLYIPDDQVCLG